MLGRVALARRCAKASGLPPEKCAKVYERVVAIIGRELAARRMVMIEGFGTFGPLENRPRTFGTVGRPPFRPAQAMIDRVSAETPMRQGDDDDLTTTRLRGLPVRPEDEALLQRWLALRVKPPERAALDAGFWEKDAEGRFWSEETCDQARKSLRAFARRCPVPLLQVGLTGGQTINGLTIPGLHVEVTAYAADYAARATVRLAKLRRPLYDRGVSTVWKTHAWWSFLTYATAFYAWLEQTGLRPPGTNPMIGIKRHAPLDYAREQVAIVVRWYITILRSDLSPRDRALLYLLANGLRAGEVGRIRHEDLALAERRVTVTGKGRTRTVRLMNWAVEAVDAYLQTRQVAAGPWVFPRRRQRGNKEGPMPVRTLEWIVAGIARRVFPGREQARQRAHIHPHGFRHYYVTQALSAGMDPKAVMLQVGHRSWQTLQRYNSMDPARVDKEVAKAARKKWF